MNKHEARAVAETVTRGVCVLFVGWDSGGRYTIGVEQGEEYYGFSWDAPSANIRGAATEALFRKCPGARPVETLSFTSAALRGTVTRGEAKYILRAECGALRAWERTARLEVQCRRERNDEVTARARAFLAA
jgi:hypothetical protein